MAWQVDLFFKTVDIRFSMGLGSSFIHSLELVTVEAAVV